MYKSVLISVLTKPREPKQVDSFQDASDLGPDFKVYVPTPTFLSDMVKANHLHRLNKGQFVFDNDAIEHFDEFLKGKLAYLYNAKSARDRIFSQKVNPNLKCEFEDSQWHKSKEVFFQ